MFTPSILYIEKSIKIGLTVILAMLFTRAFVVDIGVVNGRSMEPYVLDQDYLLVNKFPLLLNTPERGAVYQYIDPVSGNVVIKRLIGLPGDTIEIVNQRVHITIDGITEELSEPYLADGITTKVYEEVSLTVPEHHYYFLGDNRNQSTDSRERGPIHRSYITGQVYRLTSR